MALSLTIVIAQCDKRALALHHRLETLHDDEGRRRHRYLSAGACSLRLRRRTRRPQTPRLLSDNGPCYVSGDLADWLDEEGMAHVRGAPRHPQTQGKIERWHQTLKNRILLENYYLPGDREAHLARFVDHYNHQRYHESLKNLTPADVYFGRKQAILLKRERIKRETIKQRRLQHQQKAA